MAIVINGSGTVTGLAVGGLPDGTVDAGTLATNSVEAAKLADNAVGLDEMASGTDGNIISYDASGNPVAIATGSDGQVLTSTGAGSPPAFETPAGGGKILQVVSMQTNTNTGVSDATWTATAATLAITPSSTSSKVMVMFTGGMYIQNTSGDGGYAARFQQAIAGGATTYPAELGSNTNTNYTVFYTSEAIGQKNHYLNLHGIVSPNTTAAITYTFYIINHNANGVGLNGFPTKAVLTLMEIAG